MLAQALKDYKSGKRDNAVMKGMVGALTDGDITNLAAYYASLKNEVISRQRVQFGKRIGHAFVLSLTTTSPHWRG